MSKGKSSFRQEMKDFPIQQMLIICIIRFSEPLAFTSLFPYIYFMIRDFKIAPVEEDISKYSGYLASSFAFCQFLFCVKWGTLSDRIGRKPVLLMGLFGTAISLTLFGFSKNYYFAFFARSLAGALNGNIAVLRTMIGEVATDRKHQALAFSTLPLLFNFGSFIGPLIGGNKYLTHPQPNNVYDDKTILKVASTSFYDRFIQKYPYALSNIVVGIFLLQSMVVGYLFLEETQENCKNKRDRGLEIGDWILSKLGFKTKDRPWNQKIVAQTEESPLISANRNDVTDIDSGAKKEYVSSTTMYKKAFTRKVILSTTGNFVISLHNVTFGEFLPVFLASRFKPETLKFPFRIEGGLGWEVDSIGNLISSTGIIGMIIIMIVFPYLDRKLGTINGYRFSISIFPIVYFLLPMTVFTLHSYNPIFPEWFTLVFLYFLTSLRALASGTGLPQIMLLNHRAAKKEYRAFVNSAIMSFIALARCMGPIIFGYLMSLGDKLSCAWITWWALGLLALCGTIQGYFMEDSEDEDETGIDNSTLLETDEDSI